MLKLFNELKRRKVLTTLGAYAAVAFIIMQVADTVFPALGFPEWTVAFVIALIVLGFPVTFFFSWTYDLKRAAEAGDKLGLEDVPPIEKSKKILLPITGLLTIVGSLFWLWYSLGDVMSGSDLDLQMGIKKSVAVLNFDNLSGVNEGNYKCSAMSEYIRTGLHKLGKLDVKGRSANIKDLDLDFKIEGTLLSEKDNTQINIRLVNAKSESILWDKKYQVKDQLMVAVRETIISNLLKALGISPSENEIVSNKSEYGNEEIFTLIGEGIYHLDKEDYTAAIRAFDLVLESDPENLIAKFHKASTYFELNKYDDAMNIYKDILGRSDKINPVGVRWPYSERDDIYPLLCTNIEMIEDKDLAIMLLRGNQGCLLLGYNLTSGKTEWEELIDDQFVANPVIINNTVFLTSNRVKQEQGGQPTLYAYNISNGGEIFIREFPRENDNQAVLLNIIEKYNNISDDSSTILLGINKIDPPTENSRDVALIETTSGTSRWKIPVVDWSTTVNFMFLNTERVDLLLLILRQNIIALNYKTGIEEWRKNFTLSSRLLIWNQMILETNVDEDYLALWDPVSQKEVWEISSEGKGIPYIDLSNHNEILEEFMRRINKDFLILNYTNGDLMALNFDGGIFNWNRTRWTQNIGLAQKIWLSKNASDRVFCLTQDDTLFTVNTADGEIINRTPTDRHDYNIYYDDSQNAMILNNAEFLIGVDPLNGDQLWKVKDKGIDKTTLIENSVLAVKAELEDSLIIINNYNRDNGNLVWGKNINIAKSLNSFKKLPPVCSGGLSCDFCADFTAYLEPYSDDSLLLVLHDEIIKIGAIQSKGRAIRQKDVRLQIAKTHEKNRQLDSAIVEYVSLLNNDQMNQEAYWNLANIYQKKKDGAKAVKSLINYSELVLPTSTTGIKTLQRLKKLSGLKWRKNIFWDGFNRAELKIGDEKLFLFLDNNVESYSIHSSALIWKSSFGDKNTRVVSSDVNGEKNIFFITKHEPDVNQFYLKDRLSGKKMDFEAFKKASGYSLVSINKRGGDKLWEKEMDITGESDVVWMGVIRNKIIVQSMLQNNMSISAYDLFGGHFLWKTSFVVSPLYTTYDLTPAFYKGDLLLPLDDRIEYINTEGGNSGGMYANENIDQIFLFNKNSIQDNTMRFFINDYVYEYEYIVVDLDKNLAIAEGSLDLLENPERGLWINNIFVDVSSSGIVIVYDSPLAGENEPDILWQGDYNASLKLLEVNKQNIYLLDKDNNYVYEVGARSGKEINKTSLLWPGDNVEIRSPYFIVQSKNKLYVLPM